MPPTRRPAGSGIIPDRMAAAERGDQSTSGLEETEAATPATARTVASNEAGSPDATEVVSGSGPEQAGATAPRAGVEAGTRIGRFEVLEKLGEGGMGVVLAAHDPLLDRKVAIKLLRPRGRGGHAGEAARTRLLREAQAMAKLSHPNVIPVFDAAELDDRVYIAMAYVEGGTLGQWLAAAEHSWREVLDIFIDAGRGLVAAHDAGLVHRDFKPENVLIGAGGRAQVTDFGLVGAAGAATAELEEGAESAATAQSRAGSNVLTLSLTREGDVMGTPLYMAPEQHRGQKTDARTDQFGFCAALYAALYGQRAFAGDTYAELAASVVAGELREVPASGSVPAWIEPILGKGLSRDPADRHASMTALLLQLEQDPIAARRRRLLIAGVGATIVALAALAMTLFLRGGQDARDPCATIAEELAGVWDDPARLAVRRSFDATGRKHAKDTAVRVENAFDAFANEWVTLKTETCTEIGAAGEKSDPVLYFRMACLSQRFDELEALVEVFTSDGFESAGRATIFALDSLTWLRTCRDASAVRVTIPPPDAPELRDRVNALRKRIAKLIVWNQTHDQDDAEERARSLLAEARATGYKPLEALALSALAMSMTDLGAAEPIMRESLQVAELARDDLTVARAGPGLLRVLITLARYDEALELLATVNGALERVGAPRHELELIRGQLARARGKPEEARQHFANALAGAERELGGNPPLAADALVQLAGLADEQGDRTEAVTLARRAVAAAESGLGPYHPRVAVPLEALFQMLQSNAEYDEALPVFARMFALKEDQLGRAHAVVRGLHVSGVILRARALAARGKSTEARAVCASEPIEAFAASAPSASTTARSSYNAACCFAVAGDPDTAFTLLATAIAHGMRDINLYQLDQDLAPLRADPRWQPLLARLQTE